jgi:N-methylhydantoinase B/oxoprolinase/acetone carboxylase alpha subunit
MYDEEEVEVCCALADAKDLVVLVSEEVLVHAATLVDNAVELVDVEVILSQFNSKMSVTDISGANQQRLH